MYKDDYLCMIKVVVILIVAFAALVTLDFDMMLNKEEKEVKEQREKENKI